MDVAVSFSHLTLGKESHFPLNMRFGMRRFRADLDILETREH